jgi:hypothetical protein
MSLFKYRMIAEGWLLLIICLTMFWYAVLRRLSEILKERSKVTRSREPAPEGMLGLFMFLFRGDFKQTGDERLASVCRRLRQLLYGYLGAIGAYLVFLAVFRPH